MATSVSSSGLDQGANLRLRSTELTSGIDALYLSARGEAPRILLDDLNVLRGAASAADLPADALPGGHPVKALPRAWGKYRYCAVHELARIGFTPSITLPVVRFQPTAIALHALGPQGTVLWARNFLDSCGIDATLHVARLDLHSDWQGIELRANECVNSLRDVLGQAGPVRSG